MKQCHHLASDALLAPCAEEGGTFRESSRHPRPAQIEAEWSPGFVKFLAIVFIAVVSYYYFFGEAAHVVR